MEKLVKIDLTDGDIEKKCVEIDPFEYIDNDDMIDRLEIFGYEIDKPLCDFDDDEIFKYLADRGYRIFMDKKEGIQLLKEQLYEEQDTRSIICDLFDLNHTISKEEILQHISNFL